MTADGPVMALVRVQNRPELVVAYTVGAMPQTTLASKTNRKTLAYLPLNHHNKTMATIQLRNRHAVLAAVVDDDAAEALSRFAWYAKMDPKNGVWYAYRNSPRCGGNSKKIWMHREVMGLKGGDPRWVDHVDPSQTLDNRLSNLRIATCSENNRNRRMRKDNTSGYKGVSAHPKKAGLWKAQIMRDSTAYNLGSYPSKEMAAEAYAEAAKRMHGEFARLA